ncbi:MAG: hypothetical protein WCK90_00245 [archaeon]
MYGWGGSTAGWKGKSAYDFGSARAGYDKLASVAPPREYSAKAVADMKLVDPRGKTISSDSENPIIVAVDVTGSMAAWPREIFDRLPLLYQTLAKYRPNAEFCFAAIGDASGDRFPLQVNDFAKGLDLEAKVKALGCEGRGGGGISESYELFGYFMNKHCNTPKATSPFLIMMGDEKFYDRVNPGQVKHYIGDKLEEEVKSATVWKELMQKFNVYFLQKPYGSDYDEGTTREVKENWEGALGRQRVIDIPNMERAVDVAMGLIAKSWGEYDDFGKSVKARHSGKTLAGIDKSLRHVPSSPAMTSVMPKAGSKLTKPLA